MPKVSVEGLRWLLVIANAGLLAVLSWQSFEFFHGERGDLNRTLPEPSDYQVQLKKEAVKSTAKEVREMSRWVIKKAPPPPRPATQQPKIEPNAISKGGPLADGWEIAVVVGVSGHKSGTLREKVDDAKTSVTRRRGRQIRRPVRRTRSSRSRSGRRRSRRPKVRARYVEEGAPFLVDGEEYICKKLEISPKKLVYTSGARTFSIEQEPDPVVFVEQDGRSVLRGKTVDEQETGKTAHTADDDDERGTIEDKEEDKEEDDAKNGGAAPKPGAKTPESSKARPAPRAPAKGRTIPKPKKGS